jgi:hypothetical protein
VQVVVAGEFGHDGFFEEPRPVHGCVLGIVARQGLTSCGLDVLRRRKVRLSHAQDDHVAAFLAQPCRPRRDADGGGRADALQAMRQVDTQRGITLFGAGAHILRCE